MTPHYLVCTQLFFKFKLSIICQSIFSALEHEFGVIVLNIDIKYMSITMYMYYYGAQVSDTLYEGLDGG